VDSGASRHVTGAAREFSSYTHLAVPKSIQTTDGTAQLMIGKGTVQCTDTLTLSNVLHSPSFPVNLLSISVIISQLKCVVLFDIPKMIFQEKETGRRLGTGTWHSGLWYLDRKSVDSALSSFLESSGVVGRSVEDLLLLHHRRLGHPYFFALSRVYPPLFEKANKEKLVCDACEFGKHTRSSYSSSGSRSYLAFDLVHYDVWGPCPTTAVNGYKYFVSFIDYFSRVTWLYLMKNKSDVFACFKDFHKGIQTQYGAVVKVLRSDNGTEYTNRAFGEYLSSQGIQHQTTCPYTPEQNEVAERKNRHLLEVTRSMMMSMNVPKHLWGQAVLTATYLINRMPSQVLDWKSPIEMLKGKNEDVIPLKTFGCVCFVQDNRPNVGKLDPKAVKCVFVGYSATQKGYVCWSPTERRLFISMDVTF
jgi:Integrase core domain/GAG-pre-integrase domain